MSVDRFNIRVFGLLVHAGSVLVSDEWIRGARITKFPGGGMEPGEGTLDCLRREIQEELGTGALGPAHFYTTDFFQPSAYAPRDQVVSIYYTFQVAGPGRFRDGCPAPGPAAGPGQTLRWLPLDRARATDVDLPIDQVVLGLLIAARRGEDGAPRGPGDARELPRGGSMG